MRMGPSSRVYPRPRGEAFVLCLLHDLRHGLSPPTRGSHVIPGTGSVRDGSIPAHAGKPFDQRVDLRLREVYPRPRGEADSSDRHASTASGLSPPTRGSRTGSRRARRGNRSIPAHAGKPISSSWSRSYMGVYPRPRGEAAAIAREARMEQGLSPPTRGSLGLLLLVRECPRSIPAHAGKPCACGCRRSPGGVYPRPRGEASRRSKSGFTDSGLSPPTRGSPLQAGVGNGQPGSIPAHAGKPTLGAPPPERSRVYPRPRGEATPLVDGFAACRGLSPPTRGSHPHRGGAGALPRSIPAHAGKPRTEGLHPIQTPVYPRPRGEASCHTENKSVEKRQSV